MEWDVAILWQFFVAVTGFMGQASSKPHADPVIAMHVDPLLAT